MKGLMAVAFGVFALGCGKADDSAAEKEKTRKLAEEYDRLTKQVAEANKQAAEAAKKQQESQRRLRELEGNPTENKPAASEGPSEAEIKKDLVGQTFFYEIKGDGSLGGKKWTIAAGEIKGFSIKDRMTDSAAGTAELEVFLIANNVDQAIKDRTPIRAIEGVLVVTYKKFDQGWKIQYVWPKAGGRPSIPGADWGGKPFSMETVIK